MHSNIEQNAYKHDDFHQICSVIMITQKRPQKLRLLVFFSWKKGLTKWSEWFLIGDFLSASALILAPIRTIIIQGWQNTSSVLFFEKRPLCGTYLWGGEGHKAKLRRLLGINFDSPNHKANRGQWVRNQITISLPYFSHDDLLWQWLGYY